MQMDHRKMQTKYRLEVEAITFANDAIGAASPSGRTASSAWAASDKVLFKGTLEQILIFSVMAFSVSDTAILETFDVTPEREYKDVENLTSTDIVTTIDLDPAAAEGIILQADLDFISNLTNQYRMSWSDKRYQVWEEKADPANKTFLNGSMVEAMCYAYQVHSTDLGVMYTLYNIALLDPTVKKGTQWDEISSTYGPVDYSPGHAILANTILGA